MGIETVSMKWIKSNAPGHFFSESAMSFFGTTLPKTGLRNGDDVFFWTGDRCDRGGDYNRAFTLRHLDLRTGRLRTVGEFQQYDTVAKAAKAVRDAAANLIEVPR